MAEPTTDPIVTEPTMAAPPCVSAAVGEFRRLTYRALVLQSMHTTLPPVWQATDDDGTDLLTLSLECACVGPEKRPCRHWDLCLAAAVWLDTPDEWAAGVDRAARVAYFAELERAATGLDAWIATQQGPDMGGADARDGGGRC
ncbi:MAG TPA: hypothetical protein VIT42_10715 [Microlunatus sp.]